MDKPATVALQFDKLNYAFWCGITDRADKKEVFETSDSVLVVLTVKNYSMVDHQFIQIKMDVDNGEEIQLWIPRNFVKMIAEGKTEVHSTFPFAGSKTK
jgi:hypothetical protein